MHPRITRSASARSSFAAYRSRAAAPSAPLSGLVSSMSRSSGAGTRTRRETDRMCFKYQGLLTSTSPGSIRCPIKARQSFRALVILTASKESCLETERVWRRGSTVGVHARSECADDAVRRRHGKEVEADEPLDRVRLRADPRRAIRAETAESRCRIYGRRGAHAGDRHR